MADSILRLKVESQEYDSKLKRAAEGIQRLASKIHDSQGEFVGLTNDQKEFIKNLQYMNTVSQTATGKVKELETAYKGLQTMYNGFNAFEKNSEEGKILAEQLSVLKEKTLQARKEMEDANKSLSNTGGFLDQLTSKFTVNIDAIKLFNVGLQAAEGALSVAKDAFFNNEEQLDEWGRVVESSHSLYTGFMNALNTGDISGYLNNINQIVQAARDAYDALDALGTYNAFNQINVERTRTNMTESIADYRGGKGSKDAVKAAGEAYKKELQDRKRLENEAYLAAVKRVAAERGISAKDLTDALSGTYGHYQDLKNVQPTGERITFTSGGMFGGSVGVTTKYAQTREEKLGEALRHLNDTELQSLQELGAQAQRTGNEIAQVDKQLTRVLNGRQPGGDGGGGGGTTPRTTPKTVDPIADAAKAVSDAEKSYAQAIQAAQENLAEQIITNEQYNNTVLSGQRKLAEAYYSAYQVTGNEEYLNSYREAAEHVREQQAAIDANTAAQKAAKEAAEKLAKETKEKADQLARTELTKTFSAAGVAAKITDIQKARQQAVFGSQEYNSLTDNLVDATTISNLIKVAVQDGIDLAASEVDMSALWAAIASGENIDDAVWEDLVKTFNTKLKEGIEPIKIDLKTGDVKSQAKEMTKDWKDAASAIQSVGQAMSQIEDPAAKVIGTIAQAIATIALSYAQAANSPSVTGSGWGWIAFAATGAATMISSIAAIKSATKGGFAEGGIVPGNSYSGDNLRISDYGVNSGELILNRSQQDNIASQLEGGGLGNMLLETRVSAEDLIFVLNNNGLRRGYGKYIKD